MELMVLMLALLAGSPTWDELVRLRAEERALVSQRTELSAKLSGESRLIAELKANAAGPVAEARLRREMAGAQELARELDALEGRLSALRRQGLALADRVIADERDPGLRAQAATTRAELAQALTAPVRPSPLAQALGVREAATDGPTDLREKADLLKDTQDKVERELALVERRYAAAQRRRELQRSVRALDADPFVEDARRRWPISASHVTPSATCARWRGRATASSSWRAISRNVPRCCAVAPTRCKRDADPAGRT
jgi:hypothetical protein